MKSPIFILWLALILIPRTAFGAENPGLDFGVPPPPYGTFFDPRNIQPPGQRRTGPQLRRALFGPGKDDGKRVWIPGGYFWMGSDTGFPDERPRRRVYVRGFFIDKYEVTNRRFRAAGMKPAESYGPGFEAPRLPVAGVTWFQADAYCKKMGKRLPAEAEWEKAARGGDNRVFPWGDNWNPGLANDSNLGPMPVGSFARGISPYGVHDMAGNVWEWVSDRYDPKKAKKGGNGAEAPRVVRGGAWGFHATYLRSAYRRMERPSFRDRRIGVRCAMDAR